MSAIILLLFILYTCFVLSEMKKFRFNALNNGVLWQVALKENNVIFKEGKQEKMQVPVKDIADICRTSYTEDDKIIEKDKNMLARAVVGGLLFGGAGAVVGAMTALQKKQVVKKGKVYTLIHVAFRDGRDLYLNPTFGYEYHFEKFVKKFREVQRLGVAESSVS